MTPARRAWRRLDGPGRLTGIDLARGLAVLGMLAAHLLTIELFDPGDPSTWLDRSVHATRLATFPLHGLDPMP